MTEHANATRREAGALSAAEGALSRRGLLGAAAAGAAGVLLRPPAATAARERPLTYGARGRELRALHGRLAALTYLPPGHDGDRYTEETFHAVVAFQKQERLPADGVVGTRTRAALARAARPRPRSRGRGRWIEVSLGRQLAFLVDGGEVRRTIGVSTGRRGYGTPQGRFAVHRRERRSWSYPYGVWLPWAAYFTGGIAFHEWDDVPPYPASHGCVRVPPPSAREVYAFAALGRRVLVLA